MIRLDRISKPPLGVQIRSDGHWSTIDLVGAWAFNEFAGGPTELLRGLRATLPAGLVWNPDGLRTTGVEATAVSSKPFFSPAGDVWSIVFRTYKDDNSTGSYIICDPSGNNHAAIHLRSNVYLAFIGSGYTRTEWDSREAVNQQGHHTWCITRNGPGTYLQAYKDGIPLGSSSSSALVNDFSQFNRFGTLINLGLVTLQSALFYHRYLRPNEAMGLTANPWQVFEPETIWIPIEGEMVNMGAALMMGM